MKLKSILFFLSLILFAFHSNSDLQKRTFDEFGGWDNIVMPENERDLNFDFYYPIYDLDSLLALGRLAFTDTLLGIGGASCASCHVPGQSFFSGNRFGIGNGGIGTGPDRVKIENFPEGDLDIQGVRTPTSLNTFWSEEVLWSGAFGSTGANTLVDSNRLAAFNEVNVMPNMNGLFCQAVGGQFVHNIDAFLCVDDPRYQSLIWASFRTRFMGDIDLKLAQALTTYQQSLIANNAPFQRFLRGDLSAMEERELEGLSVFLDKDCQSCHSGPALGNFGYAPKVTSKSNFAGRYVLTGESSDLNDVKIPQLYNLKDARFFGCESEYRSFVPFLKKHAKTHHFDLTNEEIKSIKEFIVEGLYDPTIKDK